MSDTNESDYQGFEEDVNFLVGTLKESFESSDVRFFIDEQNDTLYIELEGLNEYSEEEIEEIASPILEIMDLDFDEIIILPL